MKRNLTFYLKDPLNAFLVFALLITVIVFLTVSFPIAQFANNVITRPNQATTYNGATPSAKSDVSDFKELFPLFSALVFLMGFWATLLKMRLDSIQSYKADLWKRKEFAFQQLMVISQDRSVQNVKNLLESIDTDYKTVVVIEVPDPINDSLKLQQIEVDNDLLLNIFTPASGVYKNRQTGVYEDINTEDAEHLKSIRIAWEVDKFFNYLIGLRMFVDSDVIEHKDVYPFLYYWFILIVGSDPEKRAHPARKNLHKYIREYFNGPPDRYKEGEGFFICQVLGIDERDFTFNPCDETEVSGWRQTWRCWLSKLAKALRTAMSGFRQRALKLRPSRTTPALPPTDTTSIHSDDTSNDTSSASLNTEQQECAHRALTPSMPPTTKHRRNRRRNKQR